MKILVVLFFLLLSFDSFSEKKLKFDSIYSKIKALVNQWESSKTEEVSIIEQKNSSSGRKINLTIVATFNKKIQKRKIKIKYSKSGVRFEKMKIFENGLVIGLVKKRNEKYLFIEVRNLTDYRGNEFEKAIVLDEKYILLKSRNFYSTKCYQKQENQIE
jgi:hypothetical protein